MVCHTMFLWFHYSELPKISRLICGVNGVRVMGGGCLTPIITKKLRFLEKNQIRQSQRKGILPAESRNRQRCFCAHTQRFPGLRLTFPRPLDLRWRQTLVLGSTALAEVGTLLVCLHVGKNTL